MRLAKPGSSASSTSGGRRLALGQRPVVAPEEDQRLAVGELQRSTTSPIADQVVAALDQLAQLAGEPGEASSSTGTPERSDQPHAGELLRLRLLGGEARRELLLRRGRGSGRANLRECSTAASVRAVRSKQTIISGGSSDSEATALAVSPEGPSGPKLVTTQTPVTKRPQTSRKALGSIGRRSRRHLPRPGATVRMPRATDEKDARRGSFRRRSCGRCSPESWGPRARDSSP